MSFIAEVSATDRFWSKVDKSAGHGPNGDCWVWTARRNLDGYGQFRPSSWRSGGKLVSAHVFSYRESFGEFDAGLQVLHRCDNPACVRAEHLFVGTQVDNMQDALAKGRHPSKMPCIFKKMNSALAKRSKALVHTPEMNARTSATMNLVWARRKAA